MPKTRRLNIAQLHWGFPPIIGGVETHLTIILPQMVKFGHKVSLLTGSAEGAKAQYKYEGINIFRTPLMDLNWLYKRGLKGLEEEIYLTFSKFIDRTKPDVIHAHNMNYFSEIHIKTLESLAKKKGCPLFLTAHNAWDDLLFLDLAHKIKWTHIIAVSHFIKKELMGAGIDDRRITVIHHGVDQDKFKPGLKATRILRKYPQIRNRPVIFHPARIGLAKGCDISVKALHLVRKKYPNALLVLAGSRNIIDWGATQQKDIAYIVNLIKYFKLRKNVLIDVYSLADMRQIYAVATVCVYPSSVGEPFGLTMLESLASGKPIVVTNAGGMPEIVRDGINGYVVPVRDFEVLASRIIQLIDDYKLRIRLGYTGRQIVESQYTKERVTNETIGIYRRFL
jgi:glycosyltransferase involved in cell wall biosynthesis